MVICYMPRSTFERTYPAYGWTGRAGVTAADVFAGKGCPVVYNGTKSPMYPHTTEEAGAYTRPFSAHLSRFCST